MDNIEEADIEKIANGYFEETIKKINTNIENHPVV